MKSQWRFWGNVVAMTLAITFVIDNCQARPDHHVTHVTKSPSKVAQKAAIAPGKFTKKNEPLPTTSPSHSGFPKPGKNCRKCARPPVAEGNVPGHAHHINAKIDSKINKKPVTLSPERKNQAVERGQFMKKSVGASHGLPNAVAP